MSVREWAEMCAKDELRTPGVDDVALKVAEAETSNARPGRRGKGRGKKNEVVVVKAEEVEEEVSPAMRALREESPLTEMDDLSEHGEDVVDEDHDGAHPRTPSVALSHFSEHDEHQDEDEEGHGDDEHNDGHEHNEDDEEHEENVAQETPATPAKRKTKRKSRTRFSKPKPKPKVSRPMRFSQTRAGRAAALERREQLDSVFFTTFDPVADWLPPNTSPHDYTNEFCAKLERKFWRNIGLGRAAWYGADSSGEWFV